MKILILEDGPGLKRYQAKGESYQEKYEDIIRLGFWWSDSYVRAFEDLGHEAEVLFPRVKTLYQKYETVDRSRDQERQVLIEQIKRSCPDVILVHVDHYLVDRSWLASIREALPAKSKLTAYYGTFSNRITETIGLVDAVFVPCQWMVKFYGDLGVYAAQIRHAYDPTRNSTKIFHKSYGLTMIGNLSYKQEFWRYRYEVVERLMEELDLQLWGNITRSKKASYAASCCYAVNRFLGALGVSTEQRGKMPLIGWGAKWDESPNSTRELLQKFPAQCHSAIMGEEYRRVLCSSQVTLNVHADIARGESVNFRLFEASGAGVCLLTDHTEDLSSLFEVDEEIASFRSVEEAVEKGEYLLANPKVCDSIAAKAKKRVERSHTYHQRAEELLVHFEGLLGQLG